MMTFPLDGRSKLVVIEPGNIARLREGKPLNLGDVIVCFTPDMPHFAELLGADRMPKRGEQVFTKGPFSPEQIDAALKICQTRKEVLR